MNRLSWIVGMSKQQHEWAEKKYSAHCIYKSTSTWYNNHIEKNMDNCNKRHEATAKVNSTWDLFHFFFHRFFDINWTFLKISHRQIWRNYNIHYYIYLLVNFFSTLTLRFEVERKSFAWAQKKYKIQKKTRIMKR